MAKLHKVSMFVLDTNGEYDNIQELIEYAFDRTEASPHFVEAQTVEFPWYDDIILNMGYSTKQDYEDFMNESTRRYKEIKRTIESKYDFLKEAIKEILKSSGMQPSDENIVEFMLQMEHETEWRMGEW